MRLTIIPLAIAAFVLGACDQATSVDPDALSSGDVAALAPAYADLATDELAALGSPSYESSAGVQLAPVTTTITFSRTRTCPQGGSVRVEGTLVRTADREARTGSHRYDATRTEQACAFAAPRGGTIVVTGNPNTAVTGTWSISNGVPGIRTVTQRGSFTWSRGDATGTCPVDLTATWDPATRSARLQGTFCNRTVDVTRNRDG